MKSEKDVRERRQMYIDQSGHALNEKQVLVCDVAVKELDWVLGE